MNTTRGFSGACASRSFAVKPGLEDGRLEQVVVLEAPFSPH
jgi:hypothetical protein